MIFFILSCHRFTISRKFYSRLPLCGKHKKGFLLKYEYTRFRALVSIGSEETITLKGSARKNSLVSHGLTLPLRNITEKQIMVFNTLVYSDKELQSGFSKKAWPFF